jgi:hypothetical protein
MNNSKLSYDTITFFEQYKNKVHELKTLKDQIRKIQTSAQDEIDKLSSDVISLEKDCLSMRKIITSVLENDIDSVEARLTDDPTIIKSTLWQTHHSPGGYIEVEDSVKCKIFNKPMTAGVAPYPIANVVK